MHFDIFSRSAVDLHQKASMKSDHGSGEDGEAAQAVNEEDLAAGRAGRKGFEGRGEGAGGGVESSLDRIGPLRLQLLQPSVDR